VHLGLRRYRRGGLVIRWLAAISHDARRETGGHASQARLAGHRPRKREALAMMAAFLVGILLAVISNSMVAALGSE
jgi:hypothetical protein